MISLIRGMKLHVKDGIATIDVNGVGYEVHVNEPDWVSDGSRGGSYYTHAHAPQEGAIELFGFAKLNDRDMFRKLLTVDSVGPKLAMRIIGAQAFSANGVLVPSTLNAVRGVGAKIAQRIVEAFGG
jgi:holliday junction DNA helicase RuvA